MVNNIIVSLCNKYVLSVCYEYLLYTFSCCQSRIKVARLGDTMSAFASIGFLNENCDVLSIPILMRIIVSAFVNGFVENCMERKNEQNKYQINWSSRADKAHVLFCKWSITRFAYSAWNNRIQSKCFNFGAGVGVERRAVGALREQR